MSEFFITGKPRGGKTFLCTKFLYSILLNPKDTRPIATNLPLRLDVIAEELRKDLKLEYAPDLTKRIRILDEAQSGEFWLYSKDAEGNDVEYLDRRRIKMRQWTMDVPDFKERGKVGCWYLIDEVHVYFPATFSTGESREKTQSDNDLRFFLSQHGKMAIDIIFITQHVEQTSKILRRLAQEYMHVRNLSREPYMGFRVGNFFRYVRSLNSPASANPAAFESGFEAMDFEKYGKMFDTTAGVGIAGTFIREPEKRGRSLWWLTLPAVGFVLGLYWLVFMAPQEANAFGRKLGGASNSHLMAGTAADTSKKTNLIDSAKSAMGLGFGSPSTMAGHTNVTQGNFSDETNVVECVGFVKLGQEYTVFLSNGESYDTAYKEVQLITRTNVIIFGTSYHMRRNAKSSSDYQWPQQQNSIAPAPTITKIVVDNADAL